MSDVRHFITDILGYFWPDCPEGVILLIVTFVIPAAQRDPSAFATDRILREAAASSLWYTCADQNSRHSFHKLVGHAVRATRA